MIIHPFKLKKLSLSVGKTEDAFLARGDVRIKDQYYLLVLGSYLIHLAVRLRHQRSATKLQATLQHHSSLMDLFDSAGTRLE